MSVNITIGQGQGITQAIKAEVESRGGSISNNVNASIWGQVMSEVKTANSAQAEGQKFYSGGENTENLNDSSSWKTNFQVAAGKVITLAQDVWNKIVQLLTGTTKDDVSPDAAEAPEVTPTTPETPSTIGGTDLPEATDETTVPTPTTPSSTPPAGTLVTAQPAQPAPVTDHPPVYYEADNVTPETVQVLPSQDPPVTGPKEGENPEYDAVVRDLTPVDNFVPPIKKTNETENLTQEDIDNAIKNLKPGESYSYMHKESLNWTTGQSYTETPITWKREEDSTLTKTTREFVNDGRYRKIVNLSEHYSSDGKELLSADVVGGLPFAKTLIASESYENGKPVTRNTDLTNLNERLGGTQIGLGDPVTRMLRSVERVGMTNKYELQEFKDNDGKTIISFKDGNFYNAKGKEIDMNKAWDILDKSNTKGKLASLIQNYE